GAGRQDILRFLEGITLADVVVEGARNGLALTLKSSGEVVTVSNYFLSSSFELNAIEFVDGTSWDVATIKEMVLVPTEAADTITGYATEDSLEGLGGNDTLKGMDGADTLSGGIGDDRLHGGNDNDVVNGDVGNDTLYGDNGNDVLNGGEGADRLNGGAGDDTLRGGAGNDTLSGDAGNDIYLFAAGDGNTTISNADSGAGRQDILRFLEGITPADVIVKRASNSLTLTLKSSGEVVTVSNYFLSSSFELNAIEFVDGTSWDVATIKAMVLVPTEAADTITGYATEDSLEGLGGNDTLKGMDGADTLSGGIGDDRLFGGNDNDVVNGDVGNDTLYGDNGNDVLNGGEGADRLNGGAGDDTLRGGAGNDTLSGDAGNDIYLFAAGDGNTTISNADSGAGRQDILRFLEGITPADVIVKRASNSLT
ncbi:calcium-binding protein, partial [Endozoicomonas arenosclerae]|uniref:calcium-binding protein n=1 Tax=Endozoicomonas arenosclerae TaxID=1633495 RepID=UPI0024803024